MNLKLLAVLSFACCAVSACSRPAEPEPETEQTQAHSASVTTETTEVPRSPELTPKRSAHGGHNDMQCGTGAVAEPARKAAPSVDPHDRKNSPHWPQMKAEKERRKAEASATYTAQATSAPTAAPGMEDRLNRFFQHVRARKAELDALDPIKREQVYSEMKRKEIGE